MFLYALIYDLLPEDEVMPYLVHADTILQVLFLYLVTAGKLEVEGVGEN